MFILIGEGYSSMRLRKKRLLSNKTVEARHRHTVRTLHLLGSTDFTGYAIKIVLAQP